MCEHDYITVYQWSHWRSTLWCKKCGSLYDTLDLTETIPLDYRTRTEKIEFPTMASHPRTPVEPDLGPMTTDEKEVYHMQGKIYAIKEVRSRRSVGLKEAKDIVETYENRLYRHE